MIKNIVMKIISVIGLFFSAVFYVLFCQKKDENRLLKEEYEKAKKEAETQQKINEATAAGITAVNEEKKENEEKIQLAHSGNHLSNFNAGLDLLSK